MTDSIFIQLSVVMVIAAVVSIIMKFLRQPLIIGYIISGVLVGPTFLGVIHDQHTFQSFSEIGIALLLFIVGLGLDINVIKSAGKPTAFIFVTNIVVLMLVSLGIGQVVHLNFSESILIGVALVFSSTIVVIKSLSDKKETHRLYGQIAIGVLLAEDILAAAALLIVAMMQHGTENTDTFQLLAPVAFITLLLYLVNTAIMPRFSKFFSSSQELLFTFALAWAFGIAALSHSLGLSMEVGALFAGVAMASMNFAQEISNRLKPLRDFFLVLFFISLGEKLNVGNLANALIPAIGLSAIALILKPLTIQIVLGVMGYTKQVGFKTAIHLSQISEFSIILAALALSSGLIQGKIVDIITLTAMITIGISSYLMHYDDKLYKKFSKHLSIFERRNLKIEKQASRGYKLVLFGYHKGGHEFINAFREMKKHYVVIDYNPNVIEIMDRQHINNIYGDATDLELLDEMEIHKAEIVVSTVPEIETNLQLVKYLHRRNKDIVFICHALHYDDAAQLYENNVAYVILPHLIGSQHVSDFIRKHGTKKAAFDSYRKKHIITLGKIALAE